MTRSMTAYSQISVSGIEGMIGSIEIHSVNRKTLDFHMHLPRELLFMDMTFRKLISDKVFRGLVSLRITFKKVESAALSLSHLKKLKKEWEEVAKTLKITKEAITLPFLLNQMEKTLQGETLDVKGQNTLKKALEKALHSFLKMKETEGKALALDIAKRLKILSKLKSEMATLSAKIPSKYRKKLLERLSDLFEQVKTDERVLREIALIAEKTDISEEIARLDSHIKQFEALLKAKDKSKGRTFDFLLQEMLREVNTLSAKSPDLSITKRAIAAKAELEKIREQVQNIE